MHQPHKQECGEHGEGNRSEDSLESAEGSITRVGGIGEETGPPGGRPAQRAEQRALALHQLRHVFAAPAVPEPERNKSIQWNIFKKQLSFTSITGTTRYFSDGPDLS